MTTLCTEIPVDLFSCPHEFKVAVFQSGKHSCYTLNREREKLQWLQRCNHTYTCNSLQLQNTQLHRSSTPSLSGGQQEFQY